MPKKPIKKQQKRPFKKSNPQTIGDMVGVIDPDAQFNYLMQEKEYEADANIEALNEFINQGNEDGDYYDGLWVSPETETRDNEAYVNDGIWRSPSGVQIDPYNTKQVKEFIANSKEKRPVSPARIELPPIEFAAYDRPGFPPVFANSANDPEKVMLIKMLREQERTHNPIRGDKQNKLLRGLRDKATYDADDESRNRPDWRSFDDLPKDIKNNWEGLRPDGWALNDLNPNLSFFLRKKTANRKKPKPKQIKVKIGMPEILTEGEY